MRTLTAFGALVCAFTLAACDDRSSPPEVPGPEPERAIEPVEEVEEAPASIETPAPYVDEMGGDLGTFRQSNDTVPEVILPEEAPDSTDTEPTVPPN